MTTNQYDDGIQKLEELLRQKRSTLNVLGGKFADAAGQFLKDWYMDEATRMVKSCPDVTKQLAHNDRLSGFKSAVQTLQQKATEAAHEFIMTGDVWWHYNGNPPAIAEFTMHGGSYPAGADKAIRLAAGLLAPILEKYNYLSIYTNANVIWREQDVPAGQIKARPMYPRSSPLKWSSEMTKIYSEYSEILESFAPIEIQIVELRKQKEQSEADDLWSKA
jgi:hypothetical protein